MKKFVFKLSFFLIPVLLFFIVAGFLADGRTDEFYLKFASPKQQSLIIGTSKAFQGLQPEIFNNVLQDNYPGLQMFNYAFTLRHSPYGPVYFNAIKEKLDINSTNGLFILAVDPWALSSMHNADSSINYLENTDILNRMSQFNGSPNFEYLVKNYKKPWTDIFLSKAGTETKKMLLHKDGWLEVTLPMDSALVVQRTRNKIQNYRATNLIEYSATGSGVRMDYLEKTIQLLRKHGDVYLVRLPSHAEIIEMENQLMPGFDAKMEELSQVYNTKYFSFADSANNYIYTDGTHLHKSSGALLSGQLANLLKADKNEAMKYKWAASKYVSQKNRYMQMVLVD